jgi:peroxiredoxin
MDCDRTTPAPGFTALDSRGQTVRLSDFEGKKNVILVFNRGFTCSHCRAHMARLRGDNQKFKDKDTEILTIGPEEAGSFGRWWRENKMPFIGIPDPQHVVAKRYNQKFDFLGGGRLPAMAVIDKHAGICFMHFGDSPEDIPSDEQILALLEGINTEAATS